MTRTLPPAESAIRATHTAAGLTHLMTPKEKKELFAQARQAGFDSVGAYLRRKAHAPPDAGDFDALLDAVRESTARANASLDQTLAEFAQYRTWKQSRDSRAQESSPHRVDQPGRRA